MTTTINPERFNLYCKATFKRFSLYFAHVKYLKISETTNLEFSWFFSGYLAIRGSENWKFLAFLLKIKLKDTRKFVKKVELVSKELNHFGVIAGLFWQIGGHSSKFVQFCSFWRLLTTHKDDWKCKSISIFLLKNNYKIFFLLHKIQTPGINMQNGRQVI